MRFGWLVWAGLSVAACDGGGSDDGAGMDGDADTDTDTDTDADADPCAGVPFGVTAATGGYGYQALAEGDPVTVVHGPQGGWHIWAGGAVTGGYGTVAVLPSVSVAVDGTVLAGDQPAQLVPLLPSTCGGTFFGVYAYLDDFSVTGVPNQQVICQLDGVDLDLTVEIWTDFDDLDGDSFLSRDELSGQTASSTVRVTAARDPYDEPLCP
jgi:hypothetical protein